MERIDDYGKVKSIKKCGKAKNKSGVLLDFAVEVD
jgi:hypothetical protein